MTELVLTLLCLCIGLREPGVPPYWKTYPQNFRLPSLQDIFADLLSKSTGLIDVNQVCHMLQAQLARRTVWS